MSWRLSMTCARRTSSSSSPRARRGTSGSPGGSPGAIADRWLRSVRRGKEESVSGLGLSGAAQRVADHARSFVQLEVQLAMAELKRKAAALGIGAGLMAGAAVVAFLALTFGLAPGAAGLAGAPARWGVSAL